MPCQGGVTWGINMMNDLEQPLFCPAWLVASSPSAANLAYGVQEMAFKFNYEQGEQTVEKEVTVGYPVLEGNDSLGYVTFGDMAGQQVAFLKLQCGLLPLGLEINV